MTSRYTIDKDNIEKRLKDVIGKEERTLLNHELLLVDLYERYMRSIFAHKQNFGKIW